MSKRSLSNIASFLPIASVQNEKFVLPADGKIPFVPLGNAPNFIGSPDGKSGQRILQVVDQEALEALKNHALQLAADLEAQGLAPELPTDFYHNQQDASSWVQLKTAEVRNDGLYFATRFTEDGESAVTGGKARFISPNFSIKGLVLLKNEGKVKHVRPTEFDAVWLGGLTNQHNFRQLKPVSNEQVAEGTSEPVINEPTMPPWRLKLINALIAQGFLTVANQADDTAIEGAVDKLTNELDALQNERLTNDLEKYKAVIPAGQEEFIKGMIKNDRAAATKFLDDALKAIPAAKDEPQTRLTNGQHAGNGLVGNLLAADDADRKRSAEQTKLINQIQQELGGGAGTYDRAWTLAQQRNPELFQEKV